MIFSFRSYRVWVLPLQAWSGFIITCLVIARECGDALSDSLPRKYGVPQGFILGPVLFTIYVNDLLSVPAHCKSVCYVDDCKLYLSFRSTDIACVFTYLNKDLREICRWCCQNSLLINPAKTKILLVGVPQLLRQLPPMSISLLGKEITPVPVAKDLGVYINQLKGPSQPHLCFC